MPYIRLDSCMGYDQAVFKEWFVLCHHVRAGIKQRFRADALIGWVLY